MGIKITTKVAPNTYASGNVTKKEAYTTIILKNVIEIVKIILNFAVKMLSLPFTIIQHATKNNKLKRKRRY